MDNLKWFMERFINMAPWEQVVSISMLAGAAIFTYLALRAWFDDAPVNWYDCETDSCPIQFWDERPTT